MSGRRQPEHVPESEALEDLRWRDEILQLMYWMRGEGFGKEVQIQDVLRFMDTDELTIAKHLTTLAQEGNVEVLEEESGSSSARRYRFTQQGVEEGRRRFIDEFEPMMKRGGHGECADPNCECHETESRETCPSLTGVGSEGLPEEGGFEHG